MFGRKRSAKDFAEEIKTHLELEADELRPEERYYLHGRWEGFDKVLRDLRYGLRSLAQSPGFTVTAVLTLALGMGANTAVFSVMNAVLMQSLPVSDADQLVYLRNSDCPGAQPRSAPTRHFLRRLNTLRKQNGAMSAVMAYLPLSASKVAVRYGAQPEEAEGDMVSGTFFSGLGVKLPRGRSFTEQNDTDHAPIAVISNQFQLLDPALCA